MQFLRQAFAAVIAKHPPPPGGATPASPYNPHDAIHAAAYLCDNGARNRADLRAALWAYNHDQRYVDTVLAKAGAYSAHSPGGGPPAQRAITFVSFPQRGAPGTRTVAGRGGPLTWTYRVDATMLYLTQLGVLVVRRVDLDGAAHLMLPTGVRHLDAETAVFEAMLAGWECQQRSRFLRVETIAPRLLLVRRFARFTNQYPWQWGPGEVEAFTTELVSGPRPLAHSTVRGYQLTLRLFCEFVTDARYGWAGECERRFGQATAQICHEWNTVTHLADYEGRPGRRALTYDEVQALFDAADDRVGQIRRRGRKGALAAIRDAVILKTVYAYGLRRRETARLDLADFRRNSRAPGYGDFGSVQVRYGKASRGSPPKRRTVLTVPELDWIVELLGQWVEELRPLLAPGRHPALWITERHGRVSVRHLNEAFTAARDEAGLPAELDLHSLRHSYVTHLLEFGYPPLMVQQQVGHAHQSTTALYTSVSDEFRNRLLEQALEPHRELWEVAP